MMSSFVSETIASPTRLRLEHLAENHGSGNRLPRLSWVLPDGASEQIAFQLDLDGVESAWIPGNDSHLIPWPIQPLDSARTTRVRVRILTVDGASEWSDDVAWTVLPETGALTAAWIGPREDGALAPGGRPVYEFQRVIESHRRIRSVQAWATAEGVFELLVNDKRQGDFELTPGFTSYHSRLQMFHFDFTRDWSPGRNVVTARLSDGWFRGQHGLERRFNNFGSTVAIALDLLIEYEDGVVERIGSGPEWAFRNSGSVADLMEGEHIRVEPPGAWRPVVTGDRLATDARLTGQLAPPARAVEYLNPTSISQTGDDTYVVDFGQNINGRARVFVPASRRLTLSYGEWLAKDGGVYRENLRGLSLDTFTPTEPGQQDVLVGDVTDEWIEPRHSTKGFRYIEIHGFGRVPRNGEIEAVVVQTDLDRTGYFRCSDERLNRLHDAVVWSFRSNALEIPTDCPQRERSGFTGDWQIFFPTASFLFDVAGFSRKWLHDLAADQDFATGRVSTVVPNPKLDGRIATMEGSAGWGDAAVIVPWLMWEAYGDPEILAEQYDSMVRWVEYAQAQAGSLRHKSRADQPWQPHHSYLWDGGFHFGEWLEPGDEMGPGTDSDHAAVATAYYFRSVSLIARVSGILAKAEAENRFARQADSIREAWRREFLAADTRITPHKQASYVRAIAFGLLDQDEIPRAIDHLVDLIEAAGGRLGTGFLSTADLLPVLADNRATAVAYQLLTRTGTPSWLDMIDRGSTTVWEKWDAVDDEGVPSGSLNHYSKGAVATFLHRYIAGIRPVSEATAASVGYKKVIIQPIFFPELTWAEGSLQSPRGLIRTRWERDGEIVRLVISIPAGVHADIRLPNGPAVVVGGGDHEFEITPSPANASAAR